MHLSVGSWKLKLGDFLRRKCQWVARRALALGRPYPITYFIYNLRWEDTQSYEICSCKPHFSVITLIPGTTPF